MIDLILLVRKGRQARKHTKVLFALGLLLKSRMYLEDNFFKIWHSTFYREKIAMVYSICSWKSQLSGFKEFYKFDSGPKKFTITF